MQTLRARLVAALIVLAAAGLLALAGITYVEQRSFLMSRAGEQARAAVQAVARTGPGGGGGGPGRRGDGGGDQGAGLPLGTYGQQRDASGAVISGGFIGGGALDASGVNAPSLPAHPQPGAQDTVTSRGAPYLVYAQRTSDGNTTVVAVPLRQVRDTLHRLLLVEALVLVAVLVALAVAAWVIVRIGLRPLDRIGLTAERIAAGDLSYRAQETDERSEVGRLGRAFNRMLDRLEGAFRSQAASEERLRRFIADASHELRTPLASIRGYAELYRIGAARSPADIDKAMRRIQDESVRMGALVEDLLTLARLDEIADTPRREVNLAALARDAVDDARATAPERPISVSAPDEATIRGDSHQLRQVLANLLRNAIVHTPDATAIDVTVQRDATQVRLVVRDHGPGLPAGTGQEIFERFWRTERGRERGRAGAGLGLAIVDGIVRGHGGSVTAADAEGGGASFTVRLPVGPGSTVAAVAG